MAKGKVEIEIKVPLWQMRVLAERANKLGVPLEEFVVYVLMRHMDDRLNSASSSSSSAARR